MQNLTTGLELITFNSHVWQAVKACKRQTLLWIHTFHQPQSPYINLQSCVWRVSFPAVTHTHVIRPVEDKQDTTTCPLDVWWRDMVTWLVLKVNGIDLDAQFLQLLMRIKWQKIKELLLIQLRHSLPESCSPARPVTWLPAEVDSALCNSTLHLKDKTPRPQTFMSV